MQVRDIFINGLGVFVPEAQDIGLAIEQGRLTTDSMAAMGFTGVAVAGDLPAPEMALRAARDAVKGSGVSPDEVALLLYATTWHQGPDAWMPPLYLQHYLVGDESLAVEVKGGCVGMFIGMELAVGFLRGAHEHKAALIAASDNYGTPLMNRWGNDQKPSALGDGASAMVLTRDPGVLQLLSICSTGHTAMEEHWRGAAPIFPPGVTVGHANDYVDEQYAAKKTISAEAVATMGITHMRRITECTKRALTEAGVQADDIKRVIVHNVPRREAEPYLGVLGFPISKSTWEFGSGVGHLGASDHAVSLHHLLSTSQVSAGDYILLSGLAPGMIYKSAVVKVVATP